MKRFDVEQGTPEWYALRAGIPTASEFSNILTPTGRPSKSAERYMHALIAERLIGRSGGGYSSHWMDRGKDLEAEAVEFYEFQRDVDVDRVGFVTNDAGTIGASPDGLVDGGGLVYGTGMLEVKCPAEHTHVAYMLDKSLAQAYYPQLQGQMWIAECAWVDILSYHPDLPPLIVRVERDEPYIEKLAEALRFFVDGLEATYAKLTDDLKLSRGASRANLARTLGLAAAEVAT